MENIVFYAHDGSENHGCEAIVRTTMDLLNTKRIKLYSRDKKADDKYLYNKEIKIYQINTLNIKKLRSIYSRLMRKYFRNWRPDTKFIYKELFKERNKVLLSIGGDNYCYSFPGRLIYLNKELSKTNKTILWGCSINPELLKDSRIIEDMNRYSLITARESITYNALMAAGITKNTKLYPDPAFTLKKIENPLPGNFKIGETVGINISRLIQKHEKRQNITYNNYSNLTRYIIENTNLNIALIPHVVKEGNNDLEPLNQLYNEFKNTGRVVLLQDNNCMVLKGYISRCRMFIAARTHASIAAYSACIPTLVVGYSVKAKGIAKDIFGTYDNYVLPVQSLKNGNDLTKAFIWLYEHEDEIRNRLQRVMPSYIEKAWEAGDEVRKLTIDRGR